MVSRAALQILHGNERRGFLFADIVDGANIGMVQSGSGLGFALEPGQRLRVAGKFVGQKLKGNETLQPRVFRFVNHAHPATTELFNNAVMGDGLADHLRSMVLARFARTPGLRVDSSYGRGLRASTNASRAKKQSGG